ncbi:alpha/beta hydrolase [Streptosporangium sandarakinum]|uniref:Pimeloyl-ACP methyl ester carboxylesterase n=1 Tax=Streptosporangium sandarakinum TaxID=1260955 RepID=A0A852V153_9ACTN|nr:alpha/beta fold hydrolase [Streptosporangium sandarakinum]NYF39525.1 pimeloyl-ACP methyl ester carboxylesterase [Streptosporangium sandarakinum]
MKTRLLTAVLAGLVLTASFTHPALAERSPTGRPAAQTATPEWRPSEPLSWTGCGDHGGECATLKAPIDWKRPNGPTLNLAIGRLSALNPAKRLGVLVVHPGGPGASGIDPFILDNAIPESDPVRQYFDLVTLDPRGVGRSTRAVCSADLVDRTPITYPADEAEYRSLLRFNASLSRDCRRQTGPLFDHVDTTSAARDIDAIRVALGERRISFFAISYGTMVGQQYAELFPGNIRAMAIDSNMDHSITSAWQYLKTTTEDFESSFLDFAKWCGETATCALHDKKVTDVWDELHAKAAAGDLRSPFDGSPISAEDLRGGLFIYMYDPSGWFDAAQWLRALTRGAPPASPFTVKTEVVDNPYPAIWCSDWKWDVTSFSQLDRYRRRLETIAPHTKLSPFWSDVTSCLNWQGPVSNPQHRLAIGDTPPILVATARHDVGTPAAWNQSVARQIPRSALLEYEGVGHGQFRNSACAHDAIVDYLIELKVPQPGTRCAPEYPTEPSAATKPAESPSLTRTGRPVHAGRPYGTRRP